MSNPGHTGTGTGSCKTQKGMVLHMKILGPAVPNMPWQDRPAGCTAPVWRYSQNPIIPADALPDSNSIFNSAVVPFDGGFAGIFRCDDTARNMNIHVGFSRDGVHWDIEKRSSRSKTTIPRCSVPIPVRSPCLLDRGPLCHHLVQRLPRPHHWCRLDRGFQDLPSVGKRLFAL